MTILIVVFTSWLNWLPFAGTSFHAPVPAHKVADTTLVINQGPVSEPAVDLNELMDFARSFKGVRYKYASADPSKGFDCSGFVLYVFKHFNVNVPRSSSAFAKIGKGVSLEEAQPGDIILFTGPKSGTTRVVGHVGIVTAGGPVISFIHATSGKAYSVIETCMSPHYLKRFVKVVRVLS